MKCRNNENARILVVRRPSFIVLRLEYRKGARESFYERRESGAPHRKILNPESVQVFERFPFPDCYRLLNML